MTDPPPSRWKVVERGRRLEVIDTRADGPGRPVRGTTPTPGLPRRLRFDGTLGWTTHPAYDLRGPRAVVLDGGLARWVGGVALGVVLALVGIVLVMGAEALPLLVVAAVLAGSGAKQARDWLTRRLDTIAVS